MLTLVFTSTSAATGLPEEGVVIREIGFSPGNLKLDTRLLDRLTLL